MIVCVVFLSCLYDKLEVFIDNASVDCTCPYISTGISAQKKDGATQHLSIKSNQSNS